MGSKVSLSMLNVTFEALAWHSSRLQQPVSRRPFDRLSYSASLSTGAASLAIIAGKIFHHAQSFDCVSSQLQGDGMTEVGPVAAFNASSSRAYYTALLSAAPIIAAVVCG